MGDTLEKLANRLKDVAEKFKELKDCGIDEEILIAYIQKKTKLSSKSIQAVLNNTEEFYDKLVQKEIAKKI